MTAGNGTLLVGLRPDDGADGTGHYRTTNDAWLTPRSCFAPSQCPAPASNRCRPALGSGGSRRLSRWPLSLMVEVTRATRAPPLKHLLPRANWHCEPVLFRRDRATPIWVVGMLNMSKCCHRPMS